MTDQSADFGSGASWERLKQRAELLRCVRAFFDQRGFLEVETPLLSHDSVVDLHLDPLSVRLFDDPRMPEEGALLWLQTSPEFGMKRLLADGATAIYQITRAFRGGERGPRHNPEFTMVEWYRVGDGLQAGMQLLDELAQATLVRGPAERISYAEAFQRTVGIDPHQTAVEELADVAQQLGFHPSPAWDAQDRDAWLDWLLVSQVEPTLGHGRPTIVFDYPASQAALAKVRHELVPVAERFELYVDSVELANGYHELTDPQALQIRTQQANAARRAEGKFSLPNESRLLSAMRGGFPACSGCALGFDRLVMVASGASDLSEVMAFTIERA